VLRGDHGRFEPSMSAQEVHDSYMSLQKVERDFRALKTGLLEVRPVFVRKESRTRGHVFCCLLALKLSREMERRLREKFGTTDSNPHAITLPDALRALGSLCLLQYKIDEKTTVTKLPHPGAISSRSWRPWASRFPPPVGRHSPLRGEQQKLRHQKVSSKIATESPRKIRQSHARALGSVPFKSACGKRSPHLASILCGTSNLELTIMPRRDHE